MALPVSIAEHERFLSLAFRHPSGVICYICVKTSLRQFPPVPHLNTMEAMKPLIFVVEDEADIARLVKHHIEAAGFNVRIFAAATTVIAEAEREKPALFMLDIMIPGGDGFELCRRIRQNQVIAMTPVIFLTAKTSESDRVLGLGTWRG